MLLKQRFERTTIVVTCCCPSKIECPCTYATNPIFWLPSHKYNKVSNTSIVFSLKVENIITNPRITIIASQSRVGFQIAFPKSDFPRYCAVNLICANFKIAYSLERLTLISPGAAPCRMSRYTRNSLRRQPKPWERIFNNARAAAPLPPTRGGTASTKGGGSFHAQLKSPVRRVNGVLLSAATDERQILIRYRLECRWQWYRHPVAVLGALLQEPSFVAQISVTKSYSLKFASQKYRSKSSALKNTVNEATMLCCCFWLLVNKGLHVV